MGAPESNAGDDFHFWWAASRALALVQPGAASRLLTAEGLARLDDPDDQYEIVDVAEYLGGVTVDEATTVLISQLKYSTRHPDQPWTASQLCRRRSRRRTGGTSGRTRSVIADLAATHHRLVAQHGRDTVLSTVRIRLVSNQPADPAVTGALEEASRWIREQDRPARRGDLLTALPAEHAATVQQLHTAIGDRLSSTAFCDFLTVLDLSLLGALDRAALARTVRADTIRMAPGHGADPAWRLFQLVRGQAMPESQGEGITYHDVLAALDVGDVSDLYPAPPHLVELTDPLPAPSAPHLAQAIISHPGAVVVARGAAGAGKTTALRQVIDHLPAGSAVTFYDCYGAGQYLNAGEERHTPGRFVLQVTNDLAQMCGTSLLLRPPPLPEDLWRGLRNTLADAATGLAPGAILVVAVDAADNAAIAAAERGGPSFLDGLLAVSLPAQVCVVLTARSHRVALTGAGDRPAVDIAAFDATTSARHLHRSYPDATAADVAAFHERTAGNPRSQFYALEQGRRLGRDVAQLLEACTRTPDALFADIVDSALAGNRGADGGCRWLAALLALSRPVSTSTLAQALEVDPSTVAAFAEGLTPGVEIAAERIAFRDEDFETFVRGQVDLTDVTTAHTRLAQLLFTLRAEDPDAAAHVADHQFAAGRYDDLLALVLAEDTPVGIADGFRREQVQDRRLDLAARAAATTDDGGVAVRVAARACDTASRLDTLSELVETNLDLVARFTDVDLLRTHALTRNRGRWLGPVHMRLAAALSRNPERSASAREALLDVDASLRRWKAERAGAGRYWRVEADDVAAAAEAYYRLDGVDAADAWLRRWRPREFAHEAAARLAARIAGSLGPAGVLQALRATAAPAAVHAPFLAYAASPSAAPDAEWLAATVAALTCAPIEPQDPSGLEGPTETWQVRMLDTTLRYGTTVDAEALARRWAGPLPAHRWEFNSPRSSGVHRLRSHAALAALAGVPLDVEALIPSTLQPRTGENDRLEDPRRNDRDAWLGQIQPLAAIAVLEARAALGHSVADLVTDVITTRLDRDLAAAGGRWFTPDLSFRTWAALAAAAAADAGVGPDMLDRLVDDAPTLLQQGAAHLWLDVAELLLERRGHADRAADLCLRAAAETRSSTLPAPERVELLTRAAGIATTDVPELGSTLFSYAVDAATGINDDAARLLAVHADLAVRARLPDAQRAVIAGRLVRAVEDVAPHVTDSRVVPYAEVAAATAGLASGIGLAAVSRWDDEDRVGWASTLSSALLGAVDGGRVAVDEVLVFDHLLADDDVRLDFQLAVIARLLARPVGLPAARLALARAGRSLRCHVAARAQPRLAWRLLDWADRHGLAETVRDDLTPVIALATTPTGGASPTWISDGSAAGLAAPLQVMLDTASSRSWMTLRDDLAQLQRGRAVEDQLRPFVLAVAGSAPSSERVAALAEVAGLPGRHGPDIGLPVLTELVARWRAWPGVTHWIAAALPELIDRWLPTLAWRRDTDELLRQLRALGDDSAIRRAVLQALPTARASLTAPGWHNIALLLGRLCQPAAAADALVGLLEDRRTGERSGTSQPDDAADDLACDIAAGVTDGAAEPLVMLLRSAFAHPHRAVRWRACHAARELCVRAGPGRGAELVAAFVDLLGGSELGRYRDRALYFYGLSADAAALTMLARLAGDRPALLAPHLPTLTRIATSRDLPHVQIRELARRAALTVAEADPAATPAGQGAVIERLTWANRPLGCHIGRGDQEWADRDVSKDRRYGFDPMDTIPYWYSPLARVFGVRVDAVAERAERWILDNWGGSEDDWMTDARDRRDDRTWDRSNNGHGAIPPEENLRLYFEYHAMLAAAGELLDEGHPVCVEQWDDGPENRWGDWLREHLPLAPQRWLAELRTPVPLAAELFGDLEPLEEWEDLDRAEYAAVLGVVDGQLPEQVPVDQHITVRRPDGYGRTYLYSALVAPSHAPDLQRALAAAAYPSDWKLPDEGETSAEVDHGPFVLRGWIRRVHHTPDTLDEHDPYAYELRSGASLPGRDFRTALAVAPDRSGTMLRTPTGAVVARVEQWSDPRNDNERLVWSSGSRVLVERSALLGYLKTTGLSLIVEVQLGRNRSGRGNRGYRQPRSRIYLIAADGRVTPDRPDHCSR